MFIRAEPMNPDRLSLLHEAADAVAAAVAEVRDFGPSGGRDGQYALDIVANDAALAVLRRAGVGCSQRRVISSFVLAPVAAACVLPVWRRSWKRSPVIRSG